MKLQERAGPALDLARMLPQVDLIHSLQVTRLSLALFDRLCGPLALDPRGRDLLEAAALWHDAGQAIREQRHHKYSYMLIMALDLPHYGPLGKQQIACIARYHRKALPHPKHEGFADLPAQERLLVRQLASLLRIADGLDYSHRSLVRTLHAAPAGPAVCLTLQAAPLAAIEVGRAHEKADLFQETFDRTVAIVRED